MKLTFSIAAAVAALALSGTAFAGPGEDQIEANKCGKCHTATTTKKAPSFVSVAEKYKGKADAEDKLIKHVTLSPMIEIDGKKEEHKSVKSKDAAEIKNMVQWILSL